MNSMRFFPAVGMAWLDAEQHRSSKALAVMLNEVKHLHEFDEILPYGQNDMAVRGRRAVACGEILPCGQNDMAWRWRFTVACGEILPCGQNDNDFRWATMLIRCVRLAQA